MSTIKSSNEHLTLNADGSGKDIKFQSNGSEVASISDGGVVTATSFAGSGANLTGISSVGGATGVDFNDNVKARFGTGNDLEIYHDGTSSWIKETNASGDFHIQGKEVVIKASNGENTAIFREDGAVELNHNNVKKFETIANGVLMPNNAEIRFKDSGGNERTSVMFDSSNVLSIGHSTSGGKTQFKGGGSYTTVAEIDDNGDFNVGKEGTAGTASGLNVHNHGWATMATFKTGTSTSAQYIQFQNSNGTVGNITWGGSSTSYNTSSDYRLKENVDYTWDATTRLKQLKPARFNFTADDSLTVDGFLAHEVSSVVPEAISGTKDEVETWQSFEDLPDGVSTGDNKLDDDGNTIPKYQAIDQSKLVPLLVKTIQELEARITALES